MVTPNETDTPPTEYQRELSDAELRTLAESMAERTTALLSQGVPLPVQEITNHHLIGLLECVAGPEASLRVREWHLTWVDRMLDQTEAALRAHMIGNLDLLNGAVPPS